MTVEALVKPPSELGRPYERRMGVLLLEDESPTRNSLAKHLLAEGFLVRRASKGIDAIREADDSAIQIILLDIVMKGRYNGIAAARMIRQRHPDKEMLFVTAHSENEEYHREAEKCGLADVRWVVKPSTDQQLQNLLKAVRRAAKEVEKRRTRLLLEKGEAEGIGRRPLLRFLQRLEPHVTDDIVEDLLAEERPALITALLKKLSRVRAVLAERKDDVQLVQMAFGPFKKAVLDELWSVYEDADPVHRKIASQLDVAVRQLSSLELEENHIDALELVLKRLARTKLTRGDSRECKRILRYRGLEILIDLGRYRKPLLDLYLNEDEENEEEISIL